MSSARPSSYAEKRASGMAAGPGSNASSRARMSPMPDGQSGFKRHASKPSDPRASSRLGTESTAHKRSASGTPNARSAASSFEERRTERIKTTTRETLISRTKSPQSRTARSERTRATATPKRRSPDPRRDVRRESPIVALENPVPMSWEPEATLLPHTTAPLATRISIPPLASSMPQALQPRPLHELSLEAQEAVMIEDLLFVLMGHEGQYIRFARGYNPYEERDRLAGPNWRILPGLDPSLQDLTQSMLRIATHYMALEAFVDVQGREEFGSVNHALCASIRKLLHEYLVLVAQLETQFLSDDSFTLQVLNIHVLPTGHILYQLYALAQELLKRNALLDDESDESSDSNDDFDHILEQLREGGELVPGNMTGKKRCKGGVVLDLLTKRLEAMSGDPAARELLTTLLRDASRPYMVMLNEWLHHGAINDPHAEFLVKEQQSIRRERLEQDYTDEYWERRYTIRDDAVPPQLEPVKDKVLLAGKYLNVVRECGGVDVSQPAVDVPTTFDDHRFLDNVNNAYAHANESLMRLLVQGHNLAARLQSMKHYFFLDPSDYFTHFLEISSSELRKPVKMINLPKLQSLLDLVLRHPGTIVSLDPFKEDVKVEMNEIPLTKSLQRVVNITGIEQGETLQPISTSQPLEGDKNANGYTSLQLDYSVPFPVSLVISRKTVWRYQALFRYLHSLRYLESQLSTTWQVHARGFHWTHTSSAPKIEIWKRRVWTLRARMLFFVQQLLYFCTAEVIEPNWQSLMSRLRTKENSAGLDNTSAGSTTGVTRTVDELMQDHVDFLDTCLKECMLTNSKLLRIHSKLMQTCTVFATYTNWLGRELEKTDPDLSGTTRPPNITPEQWHHFQTIRHLHKQPQQQQQQQQQPDPNPNASSASEPPPPPSTTPTKDLDTRINELFDVMRKYETNFSRHLQILLDALNHYAATETVVLLSLCARLSTANQGTEWAGLRSDEDGVV